MVKNLFLALLLAPLALIAQENGIAFEQHLSWAEILQKAKSEHKFVFVDCYTSWCGPCKEMDKKVYSNDSVGEWMNSQFISVKIQMDSTKHDNAEVQNLYAVARSLEKEYQIWQYPSFLFFSPDGQALDKKLGRMDVERFISMAKAAMDPNQQFYSLLRRYQQGDKVFDELPRLVEMAEKLNEDSLSVVIATDYIDNYLSKLPPEKLWTKDNIEFLGSHVNSIKAEGRVFKLYFKDRKNIDLVIIDSGYADRIINKVIYNSKVEIRVQEAIKSNVEPNWQKLTKTIKKAYGEVYVNRNIISGKVLFYRSTKQWAKYTKFFVLQMRQANIQNWPAGGMASLVINNDAFEVFQYSNDKQELEAALSWVDKALSMNSRPDPDELDTKANILYKLGRKDEGLKLEAQSVNLAPKNQEILNTYDKMKKGMPTWPTQ